MLRLTCIVLTLALLATPGSAQSDDIERMVREGMAEALEARLRGGVDALDKQLIAQAYANKARRTRDADRRQTAYAEAVTKYQAWIDTLKAAARSGSVQDDVRLAVGHVQLAGVILAGQAAADLDAYEISAGERGDRKQLVQFFESARQEYAQAAEILKPIVDELSYYEEELLAAGLYDVVRNTQLDLKLNAGWANYYLGVLGEMDEPVRREYLATAERNFQELVNMGQTGPTRYLCYLGLAMAQRELGRLDDALDNFRYALGERRRDDVDAVTEARVRYEMARCQMALGNFDEARETLAPLTRKSVRNLPPEDQPARFYINLAHVWDAYSYFLEADAERDKARDATSATALLRKAQRLREQGLGKMNRLAAIGGPWPALVQIYVAKSINLKTPLRQLLPSELLYTARMLIDAQRYDAALERLNAARARTIDDEALAGDVLFETGRCHFRLNDERAAADAFATLAEKYRNHKSAAQAATFAYQLWGRVAERSKQTDDYARLAAVLRNLIEHYADHPNRAEALWLLPVTLQAAGRFDEAAAQFAKVPKDTRNWEEAQFRRVVCQRRALDTERPDLDDPTYAERAREMVQRLIEYAEESLSRGVLSVNREQVLRWSAEARLVAAELLTSPALADHERALAAVERFERQYPESELMGRVLSVRIRAYRGLRQFDRAAQILNEFLDTAPTDEVGPTLATLAKGMQEEVERLMESGDTTTARKLAIDSVDTFTELEKWMRAAPERQENLELVLASRARMLYLAGQYDEAARLVEELLQKHPRNGNLRHTRALIVTERLSDTPSQDELAQARDAWAALLVDPGIRTRAPERYWEARYRWLQMELRLGNTTEVARQIRQERALYPDLGGAPWKNKIEELLTRTLPTTAPADN